MAAFSIIIRFFRCYHIVLFSLNPFTSNLSLDMRGLQIYSARHQIKWASSKMAYVLGTFGKDVTFSEASYWTTEQVFGQNQNIRRCH